MRSCLYAGASSSSTTTMPRSATGANTALRDPMITSCSPARMRRHSAARSASVSAEWTTAIRPGKRTAKRRIICGVSAISGTSTIAPRPAASAASIAARYTSVLPLPVTPWSRTRRCVCDGDRLEQRRDGGALRVVEHRRRLAVARRIRLPQPLGTSIAARRGATDVCELPWAASPGAPRRAARNSGRRSGAPARGGGRGCRRGSSMTRSMARTSA